MHIAVVSLGAFGHVNPTLSVVTELVNRGVRVTYFTVESFRHIIEPTGAKFVPVNSWMAENDKHNEKKEDGGEQQNDGAAGAPFVFMMEAGANIDGILEVLREDPVDAIMHDFAGNTFAQRKLKTVKK